MNYEAAICLLRALRLDPHDFLARANEFPGRYKRNGYRRQISVSSLHPRASQPLKTTRHLLLVDNTLAQQNVRLSSIRTVPRLHSGGPLRINLSSVPSHHTPSQHAHRRSIRSYPTPRIHGANLTPHQPQQLLPARARARRYSTRSRSLRVRQRSGTPIQVTSFIAKLRNRSLSIHVSSQLRRNLAGRECLPRRADGPRCVAT